MNEHIFEEPPMEEGDDTVNDPPEVERVTEDHIEDTRDLDDKDDDE